MIKFFRHIRRSLINQNNMGKYFKYAIGEIILVVVGILIALQINNWNENRKTLAQEKVTLKKFLQDLKSDSTFYQLNLRTINSIDSLHQELYQIGFKNKDSVTHNNPNFIRRMLQFNPITKDNNPDIGDKLNNTKIREAIQSYYRSMSDLEYTNEEYSAAVLQIRAYLRAKKFHELKGWFESTMFKSDTKDGTLQVIISKNSVRILAKDEEFQQLLFESSVKINEAKTFFTQILIENDKLIQQIQKFTDET